MKKTKNKTFNSPTELFVQDLNVLFKIPVDKKYKKLSVPEASFDEQMLYLSPIYRHSRAMYLKLGGTFSGIAMSVMRALSTQDLFKDHIDYSPIQSEMKWFADYYQEVFDQSLTMNTMLNFNSGSLFHEQNHRILWRLLPPCPAGIDNVRRYLNFAESMVVALDLALGDELGAEYSSALARVKNIYRPGGEDRWYKKSKSEYREYLHNLWVATYLLLEHCSPEDIPKATAYICGSAKKMTKDATLRALDLSSMFTMNTNPQWQRQNWEASYKKLRRMNKNSKESALIMPIDPLDIDQAFDIADRIFDFYSL